MIFDAVFGFAFILTADHQEFKIRRSSHMRAIGISRAETRFPTGYQSLFMSLPQNLSMFPYLQVTVNSFYGCGSSFEIHTPSHQVRILVFRYYFVRNITIFFVGFTCHKCHEQLPLTSINQPHPIPSGGGPWPQAAPSAVVWAARRWPLRNSSG